MSSIINYSFRWQLVFLIIMLSLFIGSVNFLYLRYQQQSFIQANLQTQGEAIVNLVAEDLARLITLDDADVAATITYHFKRVPEIQRVLFYDLQMKPVLVISNDENGGFPEAAIDESIEIHTKISYDGLELGSAHFVFYSQHLNKEQQNAEEIFTSLIIALFLLSLLFAFYIDRKFISRLSELSMALKNTSENKDFSMRLRTGKNDEIGQAIENFNLLTSKVEEKTKNLLFQANHDSLTGLNNRNQLLLHLDTLLKERPEQGYHAVCYLDLDKFKVVNDT
ncbi:MAG: diguanylate cyclase, partial [Gammaproteobacteria bacterium]|nr:diguanylate cyclase [Gammaproteobacteria bacterium]